MRKAKRRARTVLLIGILLLLTVVGLAVAVPFARHRVASAPYAELIERECAANDLNEGLLRAVIYCESGYDAEAVSSVGARGLMQLTEETFDWICWRLDEEETYTYDDIFDADLNLRYGAYLLHYLLTIFDGQEETAVAAYHAGVACVQEWLGDTRYSSDGETLDTIPYPDTAAYVARVMKVKKSYQ